MLSLLEGDDTSKMMFAKIYSWEKAMIGAIQKLMAEYSDLSDVVDPYSMALALVSFHLHFILLVCIRVVYYDSLDCSGCEVYVGYKGTPADF